MPRNLSSDMPAFQRAPTWVWPKLIISTAAALVIVLSVDFAAVGTMIGLAAGVPVSHGHLGSDGRLPR